MALCDNDTVIHLMTVWPTGLNRLSGPLQKKFANPRSSGMVKGRGINTVASKRKIFFFFFNL